MKNLIKIIAVLTSLVILLSAFTVVAYAESGILIHGTFNFDYANEIVGRINDYRVMNGLSKLKYDCSLLEPAMIRAAECSVKFSHTRPNTKEWHTVMAWEGSLAENISKGFSSPKESTDAYYKSDGHRENMLGDYTRVGVGVFTDDNGTNYWIHVFTGGAVKETYKETGKRTVNLNIATQPDKETSVMYLDGMATPREKALEYEKQQAPDIAKVKYSKTVFEYNGRKQAPEVTVYDKYNNVIAKKYYEIILLSKYYNYGTYTIKVRHKYNGQEFKKEFKIIPKTTEISRLAKSKKTVTIRWKSVASSATGVKLSYALNSGFTKSEKTLTLTRTKTTKILRGLKKGKTYYFRLRTYKKYASGTYYSDWSKVRKIKK